VRQAQVLVIDDDPEARDMLAAIVEKACYTVATASHGGEALQLLQTMQPELIFLDVCMPIVDGHSFRQEQRRHREWLRIPTVVMTGIDDEPMLDVAVAATMRKPVRARDLLAIVERHCHSPRAA
jgi:CheY-like chemotaxis protein